MKGDLVMAVKRNTIKSTTVTAAAETSAAVSDNLVVENTILRDDDEIAIRSLVPNVSYKDSRTGDFYQWDKTDHVEYMTFDVLKNLWRNHRGYFTNLYLKVDDTRVIKKFGLKSIYDKYDFLIDDNNYTIGMIDKIYETYCTMPNDLKYSFCNKIKNMITSDKIIDNRVIKKLKESLGLVID